MGRYFIAILWFLLTVVVVQTGMAIRTLNTCYYDGRPYGSAPMICHTLWHISLVSVFSWNCLHRPHQLKDKDSCDKIGNHFGLDNSLTRSKKQQDESPLRKDDNTRSYCEGDGRTPLL